METKIKRRGVVGVIKYDGEKYLIIRRSFNVLAPGKLCFPGGGIEPNETPQDALVREFQEELGIEVEPIKFDWETVTPWDVHLQWWFARILSEHPPIPNPDEVVEVLYLSIDEMIEHPDMIESNLPYLQRLKTSEK